MRRVEETAFLGRELARILDEKSEEKLMIFTGREETKELCAQINRLLEERGRLRAEFKQKETAMAQMLSNISHDIRTPMTVLLGYLEMLRLQKEKNAGTGGGLPESVWEMAGKAERKAAQVMELMEQFFTLSRLEAGEERLMIQRFEIGEVCRECVLDFYEILTLRQFQVEISIPEEKVPVLGDEAAVRRILFNLISNGVRYGGDGKYLGFFVREELPFVCIQVKDKGMGLKPEACSWVFDRLFRVETAGGAETYGTGLGLSIAKRLAKEMGGSLSVSSEPYVETCFTLRLPLTGKD
ncbi:MAG: HAMP domain-containing histidine kinase [Lachnospiraceae bacterium]|jgi:signal transduction histidine kinase|nr:HAMP domain-containing histidine kinase [Lachnospiraceae bacterium]